MVAPSEDGNPQHTSATTTTTAGSTHTHTHTQFPTNEQARRRTRRKPFGLIALRAKRCTETEARRRTRRKPFGLISLRAKRSTGMSVSRSQFPMRRRMRSWLLREVDDTCCAAPHTHHLGKTGVYPKGINPRGKQNQKTDRHQPTARVGSLIARAAKVDMPLA